MNTIKSKIKHRRAVTLLLLPLLALVWLLGWTLAWVGEKKDRSKRK